MGGNDVGADNLVDRKRANLLVTTASPGCRVLFVDGVQVPQA